MQGIDVMHSLLNKQEVRDRKELMAFFKSEKINCDPASTPWCAAIMNATERTVDKPGTGSLMARSFLKYGKKIEGKDAKKGDIIIFARGSNGYSGHVAYFVEWDDDNNTVICLGGNQSDMVCYAHYTQDRILGIRRYE
jgi:uncharacterized protein (TIGR02594 family)